MVWHRRGKLMNISGIIWDDIANGEGFRITIFTSGCNHKCKGCQNPETWDFTRGIEFDKNIKDKIFEETRKNPLIDGITLTGGDPMYSSKELIPFIKKFKEEFPDKSVWLYTGFKWEEILKNNDMKELSTLCDIIIDEPFILEQRDITLAFRGSRNQHIIDCKESFKQNKLIEKDII